VPRSCPRRVPSRAAATGLVVVALAACSPGADSSTPPTDLPSRTQTTTTYTPSPSTTPSPAGTPAPSAGTTLGPSPDEALPPPKPVEVCLTVTPGEVAQVLGTDVERTGPKPEKPRKGRYAGDCGFEVAGTTTSVTIREDLVPGPGLSYVPGLLGDIFGPTRRLRGIGGLAVMATDPPEDGFTVVTAGGAVRRGDFVATVSLVADEPEPEVRQGMAGLLTMLADQPWRPKRPDQPDQPDRRPGR
jgi:hypothetical protein